jgi:hypothetical protein
MVELFQHPTVGSLAGFLRQAADEPETALDDARERAEHRRRSHQRRRQVADARSRQTERQVT